MDNAPDRFPVRQLEGVWRVLIVEEDMWLDCDSEDDARTIAKAPIYWEECACQRRSDAEFAEELEMASVVMARHRLGHLARKLKGRADDIRGGG